MRLNWFMPALRKPRPGVPVRQVHLFTRVARRLLPRAFFSNSETKQRGLIRISLRRIGLSWLSSPFRRVAQAVCFAVFLWLFFYVCWPYTSQPARLSTDWTPVEFDPANGAIVLEDGVADSEFPVVGGTLHVVDTSIETLDDQYLGQFRVVSRSVDQLAIRPDESRSSEELESMSFSFGPWSLGESKPGWPAHYADDLIRKEWLPAESILVIDPLVSLSTAIASRSWVWSLTCAAAILVVCLVIPRGFCGYVCPLGTLIDLFDWLIGRRVQRFRLPPDGWWVHLKYYLLLGTLIAATWGVLVSGYVAAIPVVTRGLLFIGEPIQTASLRGSHLVPAWNAGHFVSLALFGLVLGLGLLQPRFWCKYVCPSGALFSLGNLFRLTERKVESSCINCNKCVEICPFDAIKPDFTTRTTDCTLCQTCGGVCPTHAIKFVDRFDRVELKVLNDPPTHETPLGRRGFLSTAVGVAAAATGAISLAKVTKTFGAELSNPSKAQPIRPPGSVPEEQFLQLCIRCGECFKACPNNVRQSLGFEQGLEGLWTPQVKPDWAGCESSCNACTQVCPTGAIRALPLEEKRHAKMGLAIVNTQTCLPFANREACQLCVDECVAAGYDAIEFIQVNTQVDEMGIPQQDTGFLAPVVLADKCVGCGLCQTRCYGINVESKGLLDSSAIVIETGGGREDRLMDGVTDFPINLKTGFRGSYTQKRLDEEESRKPGQAEASESADEESYLPDFLK